MFACVHRVNGNENENCWCCCRRWRCGRQQMRRTASGDCYLDPQLAIHVNAYVRLRFRLHWCNPSMWIVNGAFVWKYFCFFFVWLLSFASFYENYFVAAHISQTFDPSNKKKRRDWVYVSIGWRFASAIQVEVKQISQTRTYSVRRIKCVFVGN